ncbi:class E sortase [Bifidobacterium primatium]|uniref:Class E sortase n=2 Tax=Bifidobacterium TaxID=1678 RepID=A0A2M9HBS1_9BIFI|nr:MULTISPECIES: class E sortase [Bifidobacterium]NEG95572.1 class E sortase [Bifidobacterium sp. SMB2]NEH12486.1 class E sortase [Bifidobacterium saimiriisciurei]PJM74257.1 class E sortase [Bifidobacterium primatium]
MARATNVASRRDSGVRGGSNSVASSVLGIIGEILLTLAAVLALYIAWQLWWTGVEAEQAQADQRQDVSWVNPKQGGSGYSIAKAQSGEPPVEPKSANTGDLVAQLYVPRFGSAWHRNVVEGTDAYQLSRHGLGHYPETQMPGELGNVAIAGHRSGYGEPLAHVDTLQKGDKIIIRTKNYWYVYTYTDYKIVTPEHTEVIAAVPNEPGKTPTDRYVTLTTCEPRYTTATHRWISYGKFDYWAKVSDGVPKELSTGDASGAVEFSQGESSPLAKLSASMTQLIIGLAIAYIVVYLAALIAWRYPALKALRTGHRRAPGASIYGWMYRHQPGPLAIRWVLMIIVFLTVVACLFEWGFPWAASNIPYLQVTSNFVAVE